jgi:peptide/nickel transport system permease protein
MLQMDTTAKAVKESPVMRRRRTAYLMWRFLRRNPLSAVGVVIAFVMVLMALAGDLVAPYSPTIPSYTAILQAPSAAHWFGTDQLGRDTLSRVLVGAKYSIGSSLLIVALGAGIGTMIGVIAGYFGGILDEVLMRITDIFLAFPALILAIVLAAALGAGLQTVIISLVVVWWPWYARLIRGQVISVREMDFIDAARATGVGIVRILWRHVLPETFTPLVVQVGMDIGAAILSVSSLSFLGLGLQPPTPEWGAMISDAQTYLQDGWWTALFPGLAIAITAIGFNLIGDGLRDFLDPRTTINR